MHEKVHTRNYDDLANVQETPGVGAIKCLVHQKKKEN